MGRLVMIGRWFKGKKSFVVDLNAYREMKQSQERKQSIQNPSKDSHVRKIHTDK